MSADEKAFRLAQANQAVRDLANATQAVRLLERIAQGPAVRAPRAMARELRDLADGFEAAA